MKRFCLFLSGCLLMALQSLAAPLFNPGSGVVEYNAYKPFADRPVKIHYYFPETADPATAQVLMLIPGAGRDAGPLLNAVREKLDKVNVIAFSLEFPAATYPVRRTLEESGARAYHALALSLERRIPRLASGVLCHEREIPGVGRAEVQDRPDGSPSRIKANVRVTVAAIKDARR